MVCAMHRMFQSADDDRIMDGDFDPQEEKKRREEEQQEALRLKNRRAGLFSRLWHLLPTKA